MVKTAGKAS